MANFVIDENSLTKEQMRFLNSSIIAEFNHNLETNTYECPFKKDQKCGLSYKNRVHSTNAKHHIKNNHPLFYKTLIQKASQHGNDTKKISEFCTLDRTYKQTLSITMSK